MVNRFCVPLKTKKLVENEIVRLPENPRSQSMRTRNYQTLLITVLLLALQPALHAAENADQPPYRDDPAITQLLDTLVDRTSLLLPPVNVDAGGLTMHGVDKFGPGQRDYCNRMAYATDRQTALYAGGNHQVPHRMNDVWEYHLGSNTWHLLYEPDGGNAGQHKAAYFLTSRTLVAKPDTTLTDEQQKQIDDYRDWWSKHVMFRDGHLTTTRGGPIMPAHTWDAFCYDERAGKLLWGMGASPAAQLTTHAYFTGQTLTDLEQQTDAAYTPMWMFDPVAKRWLHYRSSNKLAELRGMGATMTYLPDLGTSVWYVAAQNVSPPAFEMWLFDAVADQWTELKPNGGKSISTLATKEHVAPMAEQQTAYSPKHRKLVAVLGHETFVYDVPADEWSKVNTDERIYGHDAHSVFAYDSRADVFLLAYAPDGRGKELQLAAFSLATNRWELIEPNRPPAIQYGGYTGYYDPRHNTFVVQGRYSNRVWVYRHAQ
jgi:hypothetical protein